MFEKGALINFAGNRVLRFVPPLIVSTERDRPADPKPF
jgi:acetylornithine/N-succinyldiaminopimelate aminotransferase